MPRRVTIVATLGLTALGSTAAWGQTQEEIPWYEQARGEIRVGAYYLRSTNTRILLESLSNPLAATVNFQRELNLDNRVTSGRFRFGYQFNGRHRFDLSYYSIDRDGDKPVIEREINLGNITIPVGASVRSHFDTTILKLTYTNVFHRTERVRLGFSAGVNFSEFDVGASFVRIPTPVSAEPEIGAEQRDGDGPLPVIGGRLSYSIAPRWRLLTVVDLFLVESGDYGGTLTDIELAVENSVSPNVGWGIGFQVLNADLNTTDADLAGTFQTSGRGINLYASVYF